MAIVLTRGGRVWATILVVYALLLAGLAPGLAAGADPGVAGVLCSQLSADAPDGPDEDLGHGALCCVLCSAPVVPLAPAFAGTGPIAFPPEESRQRPAAWREIPLLRAPPAASPHAPRPPPIVS